MSEDICIPRNQSKSIKIKNLLPISDEERWISISLSKNGLVEIKIFGSLTLIDKNALETFGLLHFSEQTIKYLKDLQIFHFISNSKYSYTSFATEQDVNYYLQECYEIVKQNRNLNVKWIFHSNFYQSINTISSEEKNIESNTLVPGKQKTYLAPNLE